MPQRVHPIGPPENVFIICYPPICAMPLLYPPLHHARLDMILDRGFERDRVRTDDLSHLLAVLEEHECRHRADGEFLRDVWDFVYVELEEARVGVLAGESEVMLAYIQRY